MNEKSMHITTKAITLAFSIVISPVSLANILLADSVADWDAAVNNGIDNSGNSVTAGSLSDAAEQGHAAASNGFWNYKGTNGPAGGTFSGSPGFLVWDNSDGNYSTGQPTISRTRMTSNSTQSGNEHSVREWFGTGLDGELINISGTFTTSATTTPSGPFNNGMHVYVILDSFVLGEALLAPNEDTYSFNFENVAVSGGTTRVRFAAGPDGPIPDTSNGINDFFNDGVDFSGQIALVTPVPIPPALVLFGTGLIGLTRLSRRKKT